MTESTIGIAGISYVMPQTFLDLDQLEMRGLLESKSTAMHEFGFRGAYVDDRPAGELALEALRNLIDVEQVDPDTVDLLLYAGAIPESHRVASGGSLDGFAYPASWLQHEAGLGAATAIGISQTGCAGLMTAVALAADHLRAHPEAHRAICVSSDVLPPGSKREIIYNVISDGACALLIDRAAPRNRILAYRSIAKGYYWNPNTCRNELVAAYFPTARTLIAKMLQHLQITAEDVSLVLPHNVSLRSWQILLPLVGLSSSRLFADNIPAKGHVIAADNFINLKDAWDRGCINPGGRLLLFTFGFGANWACLALEA